MPSEGSGKLVPGFLWILPNVPFPLADFTLYPFAVITLSHDHDYVLSPVSPPSKSLNLGEVWQVPSTSRKRKYYVISVGLSLIIKTIETKMEIISYV